MTKNNKYKWEPVFTFEAQLKCTITYTGFAKYSEAGVALSFLITPEMQYTQRHTGVSGSSWKPKIEEFARKNAAEFTGLQPTDFWSSWDEGVNRTLVLRTEKTPLKDPPDFG